MIHFSQVFTSTSTTAFKTFPCDNEAVEGESYLRADYSLSCNAERHLWYKVYAGIMIVVSAQVGRRCRVEVGAMSVWVWCVWVNPGAPFAGPRLLFVLFHPRVLLFLTLAL